MEPGSQEVPRIDRFIEAYPNQLAETTRTMLKRLRSGEASREEVEALLHEEIEAALNTVESAK